MLCWIHPRKDRDGYSIPNEYEATRLPTTVEFCAFVCERMHKHRLLRITAGFQGCEAILRDAYRMAIGHLPLQFHAVCKPEGIEISWVEAVDMQDKYRKPEE